MGKLDRFRFWSQNQSFAVTSPPGGEFGHEDGNNSSTFSGEEKTGIEFEITETMENKGYVEHDDAECATLESVDECTINSETTGCDGDASSDEPRSIGEAAESTENNDVSTDDNVQHGESNDISKDADAVSVTFNARVNDVTTDIDDTGTNNTPIIGVRSDSAEGNRAEITTNIDVTTDIDTDNIGESVEGIDVVNKRGVTVADNVETLVEGDGNVTRNHVKNNGVILSASALLVGNKKRAEEEFDNEALLNAQANGAPTVLVERALYSQKNFNERYEGGSRPSPTVKDVVKKKVSKCMCSGKCVKDFLFGMFPFIQIMKNYNVRQDLMGDVVSGLTVGIMHIPQGMAYGMLTTLPPVYGLYMSFFPVLVYFFFGSSKHISIGTFAVACLMIGSSVNKGFEKMKHTMTTPPVETVIGGNISDSIDNNNTTGSLLGVTGDDSAMSDEELTIRLQYAMSVTFLVGIVQLVMGIFRLGFITVYLSDPLISGFTTGAACHVFTSQIKHVFGIKTARYSGAFKLIYTYKEFFSKIPTTNSITLITSILCIVILYSVSRFINQNPKLKPKMFMPVPIELIVVVLGTVVSYLVKLNEKYDVVIVDDIPTGLPMPNVYAFSHLGEVVSDAIALSIVIFAISISMGKLLAKKHEYEVDANQELIAFGIATVFSAFFSSAAPSASLSRSLVQERVGGKTQVAGIVSCCLLLVVLLAIGPYFRTLPNCVLGASIMVALEGLFMQVFELPTMWRTSKLDFAVLASIIIVALRGMFLQVLDLKKLWSISIIDFMVWIVSFLATVLLDVDLGLGVAVIFAIMTVVCRSQRPYATLLGQMAGTDIYRDINIYQESKEIPGLKIFRFDQSLFFVNTEHFRNNLYKRTINPRELKIKQKKRQARQDKEAALQEKEMKPLKKPREANGDAVLLNKASDQVDTGTSNDDRIEVATGLETPNLKVRHDMMELEITVGDPGATPDIFNTRPECPPDVDFHTIILDCSSWSFVDSMAVKVLTAVIGEYSGIGVKVCLANCKGGIRDMFAKTRFYETLDHSRIYVSIHDAVVHSLHLESPSRTPRVSTVGIQKELGLPRVSFVDDDSDKSRQREDSSLISDEGSD